MTRRKGIQRLSEPETKVSSIVRRIRIELHEREFKFKMMEDKVREMEVSACDDTV